MEKLLTAVLLLTSGYCFGESITVYSKNGVSLSYKYEKTGTSTDNHCPNVVFDHYQVSAKVQNINNQAIAFDHTDWLNPRINFLSSYCTKEGNIFSDQTISFTQIFSNRHVYATSMPNTGFGAVHPYFLDPKEEYTTLSNSVQVPHGTSLPKPEWYFPAWKFIDVPNQQTIATTSKAKSQSINTKDSYENLIVGKWRVAQSYFLQNGKEVYKEVYIEGGDYTCFDLYEANKKVVVNVGSCVTNEESGRWVISNNTFTHDFNGFFIKYEILQLDKSILKIKDLTDYNTGRYSVFTYEKVK